MQFFSSFPNTKCLCSISGRVEVPWSSGLRRLAGDARIGRSIPITAFMPLRKALYLHCSFIVHQINENVTVILIPTYARVKKYGLFYCFCLSTTFTRIFYSFLCQGPPLPPIGMYFKCYSLSLSLTPSSVSPPLYPFPTI